VPSRRSSLRFAHDGDVPGVTGGFHEAGEDFQAAGVLGRDQALRLRVDRADATEGEPFTGVNT
jgi:hypothetical protein